MEKKVEAAIFCRVFLGYIGVYIEVILGSWKEHGNYCKVYWGLYSILGLYWDNGKENGNYYIRYWGYIVDWGYIGIMQKTIVSTIVY